MIQLPTKELVKLIALQLSVDGLVLAPLEFFDEYFTAHGQKGNKIHIAVQQCSINDSIQAIMHYNAHYIALFFGDKVNPSNTVVLSTKDLDPFVDTMEIGKLPQLKYKFHLDVASMNNKS